jgi:hypothetical protein
METSAKASDDYIIRENTRDQTDIQFNPTPAYPRYIKQTAPRTSI